MAFKIEINKKQWSEVSFRLSEITDHLNTPLICLTLLDTFSMREKANPSVKHVNVHIILAGDEEKVFKNKDLMEKYNAVTPAELVKKILTPGEIAKLSDAVLALSGYNADTVEEVKKTDGRF